MKRHSLLLVGILLSLAVVASVAAVKTAPVDQLRRTAEELVTKQSEMGWKSWVLGEPSNQALLYDAYPDLFTKEAIAVAREAYESERDPLRKKALHFFVNYLEAEYIYKETAVFQDIASDLEAESQVLVDGKLVPYRDLNGLLANAKTAEERQALAEEQYRIYRLLNDVVLTREWDAAHRLAKELGYQDYVELAVTYKMFDLNELTALSEKLLAATEAEYLQLFDEVSPIPRDRFRRSDISFVLGAKDWDAYFTMEKMIPALKTTLAGLGIDVESQKNLLMHTEELPKKNPRAVCFAIHAPGDVRISIKPQGGKKDYQALFHEMGHAEHFANTTTPFWEFQQLGSYAVTEGYAYLFEGLIENRFWLQDFTDLRGPELDAFLKHARFTNLYMLRRYMSKVLYEVKLHRGEPDPQKLYQTLMSRGYGFQLTEQEALRYLTDVDTMLYSADYLQAFFLQGMLETRLAERFGDHWWQSKEAGDYLKSLYAHGNEFSAKELARELGYTSLEAGFPVQSGKK